MANQEVHTVDIASIERELTDLWTKEEGDSSFPIIRACSMNFIVLGSDDAGTEGLLDELSVEHPARTFLISTGSSISTKSVEGWVAARCSIPLPGEKQVCCEQIHLRGGDDTGEKISSVVSSLLVPDVPVVLWRRGPTRVHDELFAILQPLCDFIILDSAREGNLITSLGLLRHDDDVLFGDLAWECLDPWRHLFAHVFDSAAALSELDDLTKIRIVYSEHSDTRASGRPSALLFTGWLCHALDMHGGKGETEWELMKGGTTVQVVVAGESHSDEEAGPLLSIALEFNRTSLLLSASGHCFQSVRVMKDGKRRKTRMPLRSVGETDLLSRLLIELDADQLHRKSLLAVSKNLSPLA